MNQENPYAAPQASLSNDRRSDRNTTALSASPRDFRWFWLGALVWLLGLVGCVVAVFLSISFLLFGLVLVFLGGTILLSNIPASTPGRGWFLGSVCLQILSPIIGLQAIQDVPNPDWDRYYWSLRIAFWGEGLAVLFVLLGIYQLAKWLRYESLSWVAVLTAIFLVLSYLSEAWIRSTQFVGYDGMVYGLLWMILAVAPTFLLLVVCLLCAMFVPSFVGRPYAPPYDPRELTDVISLPSESSSEESP